METQQAKKFGDADWEEYAKCYDMLTKLTPYQSLIDEVVAALNIQQGEKILDAACGTGNLMLAIERKSGETGIAPHVTGCDNSVAMLAQAKAKCADSGTMKFTLADLNTRLPFADESFDSIASINTIYALNDPMHMIREFHRVLKHKGKLVLVTPKQGYENGLILKAHCGSRKPDKYWKNIHISSTREKSLILEACGNTPLSETLIRVGEFNRAISINKNFHFFTQQELEQIITANGFRLMQHSFVYASQCHLIVSQKTHPSRKSLL